MPALWGGISQLYAHWTKHSQPLCNRVRAVSNCDVSQRLSGLSVFTPSFPEGRLLLLNQGCTLPYYLWGRELSATWRQQRLQPSGLEFNHKGRGALSVTKYHKHDFNYARSEETPRLTRQRSGRAMISNLLRCTPFCLPVLRERPLWSPSSPTANSTEHQPLQSI